MGGELRGAVWPLPQVVDIRDASAFECPLVSPVQPLGAVGACSFLQDTRQAAAPCSTCLGLGRSILCSRSMWFCGGSPMQALRMFSIQLRWRKRALTTGLPGGTSGALKRKPSSDSTGWKPCGSGSVSVQKLTRWHSSVSMARSSMMGAARSESSQVLCSTSVLVPPSISSDVYSSIARLLSPTYGTYLMTTQWSGSSPGA